jgi:hypothetical protein
MQLVNPLASVLLLAVAACSSAWAQSLPLAPMRVSVAAQNRTSEETLWKVGPLTIRLRSAWKDASKSHSAQLAGPEDSLASFTIARVTSEALNSGYNILVDPTRGPDSFGRLPLDWTDCRGAVTPEVKELQTKSGMVGRLASCPVLLRLNTDGTFAQIAIYSRTHMANIAVVGGPRAVQDFLSALESAYIAQ